MKYVVGILDLDGNVLEESEVKNKEEIIRSPSRLFEMLESFEEGHHIIIYPVFE